MKLTISSYLMHEIQDNYMTIVSITIVKAFFKKKMIKLRLPQNLIQYEFHFVFTPLLNAMYVCIYYY